MLKNHFKIAIRNIWQNKVFSIINVIGLAVGITACLLIFLYVRFELGYDKFNSKADRIYRVVYDVKTSSETIHGYQTCAPLAPALKTEFDEIQTVARVAPVDFVVNKGILKFQEQHALLADSSLFDIFDLPFKYGNPKTALQGPNKIVFSESAAKKYFGDSNPVGKQVTLSGRKIPCTVTGIMKDIPENSHLKGDMLISLPTYFTEMEPEVVHYWGYNFFYTYVLLRKGLKPQHILKSSPAFLTKYAGTELAYEHTTYNLDMEPLSDVYMQSSRGAPEQGNFNNVTILLMVAIFVLVIAVVNFVNLSTARSLERAKEVGIRKVMGAFKGQLMVQFLMESVIISFMSFLLALVFFGISLPVFDQIAGKNISHSISSYWVISGVLFVISALIGLLGGVYPAFVLSDFKPSLVLKGKFSTGEKGVLLRRVLVVFQFSTSIALIAGTLIVYSQLTYMRNKPLGFNKENIVVINVNEGRRAPAFQHALSDIPAIKESSRSSSVPGHDYNASITMGLDVTNSSGKLQTITVSGYDVDYNFIDLFKMKLLAGRGFSKSFPADSSRAHSAGSIILNKAAITRLGYRSAQEAIGKIYRSGAATGTIIGVVDDFNFHSLKESVQPVCLSTGLNYGELISVKVDASNLPQTLAEIKKRWDLIAPDRPFIYFFLEETLNSQYRAEEQFGTLFFWFAVLAIFISCLGLLALASYSTLQRTKEIGIRKVLGATAFMILNLLVKDFMRLIAIAFFIATPLSLFVMNNWLGNFPYRITVSWWEFALAGLFSVLVAWATLSYNVIKAALKNPVESLRVQ